MAQQINLLNWATTLQGIAFEDGFSGLSGYSLRINGAGTGWEYYVPGTGTISGVNATAPLTASGTSTRTIALNGITSLGTALQVMAVNAGATALEWVGSTGTDSFVRSTSPTITTPTITTNATINSPVHTGAITNISELSGVRFNGNSTVTSYVGITFQAGGGGGAAIAFGRGDSLDSSMRFYANPDSGSSGDLGVLAAYMDGTGLHAPSGLAHDGDLGFFGTTPVARQDVPFYGSTACANPVTDTSAFISQMESLFASYIAMEYALNQGRYGLINTV